MINGYIRTDRSHGTWSDIIRNNDNSQEWVFPKFVTALEKWTQRNPISNNEIKRRIGHNGKEKLLNTKQHQKRCIHSEDKDHNSTNCKKFESIAERKIRWKKICFSYTGKQQRKSDCRSKRTCLTCNEGHHSSIGSKPIVPTISSTGQGDVTHPVVVLLVDVVKCRPLLGTGARSSYRSAGLMNVLKKKTFRKETKHIEMMTNSTTKNREVFKVQI